jgi:hypothetical protein
MSHIKEINHQCQRLPENLQKEVLDFIYFLESRYSINNAIRTVSSLSDAEIEQACGILKAPRGVSLEDIETAIKQGGSQL